MLAAGLGYADCVAAVMFEGWSDVSALFFVCGPCSALFWFILERDASSGWRQWRPVKIKDAVDLRISGESWVNPR